MSVFDGLAEAFTSALGEPVTYTPAGGAPAAISGIFELQAQAVFADPGAESVAPRLSVNRADLAADPAAGDAVIVRGTAYAVRVARPDGKDMVELQLEEAS